MKKIPISVESRSNTGKGPNRRLRVTGAIPAVLYGQGAEAANLAINEQEFKKATAKLGDEMVMFDLNGQLALLREVQRHPVTSRITHMDFMRLDVTKPIDAHVSVHGVGTPVGVRKGGVLEQVNRTLHLRCLPDRIPAQIEVDCAVLDINQAVHVSDIPLGEGIEILTPAHDVVFHVVVTRSTAEEEAPAAAEGAAAAPAAS
jgi:large subunit ribosomal protein L25